jgi:hypothetical protein
LRDARQTDHSRVIRERVIRARKLQEKLEFSARAFDRILKVSRTIADLDGAAEIQTEHLAEAINSRTRTGITGDIDSFHFELLKNVNIVLGKKIYYIFVRKKYNNT